ncbi:SOS response-associated peptidase [Halapricum hydrolyticum]|uniref:SOS response-associated peptidase n=1 Tax=Halapricum hydrolyticum TaxID=2979991 RepID=A0AAE3IFR6_9EURY|nr:SOS response-associated peptidase [Halapricum hydrolyticum]MCU4719544.1 SOS response-associated peptidase [Halapricum hydrolyticum]MCU4728513.1 SOS response-associated peptidase [Halapricum hydrolyticum]
MCGRTSLFTPQSRLEERFDATAVESLEPRYNIAPREELAVVCNDAPETIDLLEWGLLPSWADPDDAPRPINARAETLAEKPTFAEAFERRRCLVLADGFYEWADTRGGSQPYRVERTDGDPFAMAGLFERQEGNDGVEGTVTVVTTEPNAVVEPLHHRMAVVLASEEQQRWLSTADREVLDPPPASEWHAYPVSTRVNDPSNDDPGVLEEIEPDTQTGLDEFA